MRVDGECVWTCDTIPSKEVGAYVVLVKLIHVSQNCARANLIMPMDSSSRWSFTCTNDKLPAYTDRNLANGKEAES
jgi:hypothetical protein